jgi:hypothetical protein
MPESGNGGQLPTTYCQRAGSWRDADIPLPIRGIRIKYRQTGISPSFREAQSLQGSWRIADLSILIGSDECLPTVRSCRTAHRCSPPPVLALTRNLPRVCDQAILSGHLQAKQISRDAELESRRS